MGCVKSYFKKAQGAGVSPSSTAESANKVPIVEVPVSSRSPSAGNISVEKPVEQPESNDTSCGVEATAVRKLAASTGTVAILGTTAQTLSKDNDSDSAVSAKDVQIVGATVKDSRKTPVNVETPEVSGGKVREEKTPEQPNDVTELSELPADGIEGEVQKMISESSDMSRQVPQITETLVASLEASPVEELASRSSPYGAEPNSSDVSGFETQVTRSTDIGSDDQIEESTRQYKAAKQEVPGEEAKSENNETASTKTIDNDISSEQMKTNSLSDISFSDLDDKEASTANAEQQFKPEEPANTDEPSGESDRSEAELKLVEITPDSASESSQQITKEESTSDITSDNQQEESKPQGDEERLISSPSDERSTDIEDDEENKRNAAAIKIQSSFRGFKVRKPRFAKEDEDQLEAQLTASEIENVKEQVEGIIKEAEETTESLRNTPDVELINGEEEFPAPPDDILLNQLNDDDQDKDTQSLNNIETVPYPNTGADAPVKPATLAKLDSDEKQSPTDNDESTTAELARMTADEDLPAPDFELLESSCTDDLNTEIATSDKGLDDEPQDSTEGDVTIEEDSDKLKELQKPLECDKPLVEVDADVAATKIQANVRGFLARKQVVQGQAEPENGTPIQTPVEASEETKSDTTSVTKQNETKAVGVVEDVAENVANEPDLRISRNETPASNPDPTPTLLESLGEPNPSNVESEDKLIEGMKQKQSQTPQSSELTGITDGGGLIKDDDSNGDRDASPPQNLSSETSELVEPSEGSMQEPVSIVDELNALDKLSSQSDSISQDTISQNTVEEMLKQQDNMSPKPSINEKKEEAFSQDAFNDRTEADDAIADDLIKTLPESTVEKNSVDVTDEGKDQPVNIELVSEQPKAITPDITDKDGNENSSQSIEELSSNPDRESLYPSNENSTIDLPELSSAEETKGSSTASITSDSAKEKTSEASELTRESDSKATTDIDIEEIPDSEIKASDEYDGQPKLSSEPKESLGAPKEAANVPPTNVSVPSTDPPVPSDDGNATSNDDTKQFDATARPSTGAAAAAENGKDEAENPVTQKDSKDLATSQGGAPAEEMKTKSKDEPEPAGLKNGTLPNTPSELDDELLNNSATKIQANIRGYLSRKKQSTNKSEK